MSKIVDSASLLAFKGSRRMQIGAFVNSNSGDTFKSIILTDGDNNRCFVAFSSRLGELTPAQIVAMKDDLQVVTMDSGSHILCKKGAESWEDVAL